MHKLAIQAAAGAKLTNSQQGQGLRARPITDPDHTFDHRGTNKQCLTRYIEDRPVGKGMGRTSGTGSPIHDTTTYLESGFVEQCNEVEELL